MAGLHAPREEARAIGVDAHLQGLERFLQQAPGVGDVAIAREAGGQRLERARELGLEDCAPGEVHGVLLAADALARFRRGVGDLACLERTGFVAFPRGAERAVLRTAQGAEEDAAVGQDHRAVRVRTQAHRRGLGGSRRARHRPIRIEISDELALRAADRDAPILGRHDRRRGLELRQTAAVDSTRGGLDMAS